MQKNQYPEGWNQARIRRVLAHYENLTDEEMTAEDEKAFKENQQTVVEVPVELVPLIREILALYRPT